MADPYARPRKQAAEAFADHQMTVLHDEGLYRHLRFAKPGTYIYGFDIVTWPGYLHAGGDIEDFTFARVQDMVDFFGESGPDINPGYWSEKITNRSVQVRHYSRAALEKRVEAALKDLPDYYGVTVEEVAQVRAAWATHVEYVDLDNEHAARQALAEFSREGHGFGDAWEWDLSEWGHHFLLSCFAIVHGLKLYRAARVVA